MRALSTFSTVVVSALLFALPGCSAEGEDSGEPKAEARKSNRTHSTTGDSADDEVSSGDGSKSSATPGAAKSIENYKEAVTIQVNNAASDFCSGVLIAPTVVLTAAHCIVFNAGGTWTIKAPQIAGQPTQTVSAAEPMEAEFANLTYENYASNQDLHDLGLVFLDAPFDGITSYPTIKNVTAVESSASASTKYVAAGRKVVSADSDLELSQAVPLSHVTPDDGYPHQYKTPRISDGGDSGGPLFLNGTHTLVGTETLFDPVKNVDYWARLDGEVYAWLDGKVAEHGGWKK